MTEEQMKEWFKRNKQIGDFPHWAITEDVYQAFKSRLKSEATLNLWPEEK